MDSKTKRGVIGGGVVLVALIAVLAVLLVGAKGDASDTKDQLASAERSAQARQVKAEASRAADAKTIQSQSARILALDPPAWSKAVAAQQYLAIVKGGNDRISAFNKLKNPSLKQSRTFASEMAVILNKQAQMFQAGKWPKFAKSAINDVIDNIADDVDSYVSQSKATSVDEYNAVSFSSNKPAQKARIVLGLPRAT